MRDMAGNELTVGTKVLICLPYYKHLVEGTIEKVGVKMVTCSYPSQWNKDNLDTTTRYPNQVIVPMKPGYGPPATAGSEDFPDEDFPLWD